MLQKVSEIKKITGGQSFFLDALRYAAASMVVLYHARFIAGKADLSYLSPYFNHLGSLGVEIFFVLSGFVIAYTVKRKMTESEDYSLKKYLLERFSRIYIVLVPALVLVALLDYFVIQYYYPSISTGIIPYFFTTFFMLSGVRGLYQTMEFIPTIFAFSQVWSLTYEFYFYIMFGVMFLFFRIRGGRNRFAGLFIMAFIIFMASRLGSVFLFGYNWVAGAVIACLFQKNIRFKTVTSCLVYLASVTAVFAASLMLLRGSVDGAGDFLLSDYLPILAGGSGEQLLPEAWLEVTFIAFIFFGLLMLFEKISVAVTMRNVAKILASYTFSMYLIHDVFIDMYGNIFLNLYFTDLTAASSGIFWTKVFLFLFILAVVNIASYLFSLITEKHTGRLRKALVKVL